MIEKTIFWIKCDRTEIVTHIKGNLLPPQDKGKRTDQGWYQFVYDEYSFEGYGSSDCRWSSVRIFKAGGTRTTVYKDDWRVYEKSKINIKLCYRVEKRGYMNKLLGTWSSYYYNIKDIPINLGRKTIIDVYYKLDGVDIATPSYEVRFE